MTEKNENMKDLEQQRVNQVIHQIEKKITQLENKTGNLKSDVVNLRKTFWEDVTINMDDPDDVIETHASLRQQAELLSERERSHGQFHKQYRNLQRLKSSPYFGRIDFFETGEDGPEQVYIGLFSLMDENDENFLIYDWRAPISSMYYDFSPGPAHYETMDGAVAGEIQLKRQYIIRQGKIKGLFDTGITIGDEILQAVLSDQADSQMKNIVATIQQEQNQIIRNNKKKFLIVQGAAGSGKTSAGMQRVAYLLYQNRETLKAENILLFSPNQMFNSYVGAVLPELGEDNMEQSTFNQYLQHRIRHLNVEDPYSQLEYMLASERNEAYYIRKESIQFKASLQFKKLIDDYVQDLLSEGIMFKSVNFRGEPFISKDEMTTYFYSLESIKSIPNRLNEVKSWILSKLDEKEKLERSKDWVEQERELLDREDYLKIYKKLQKERRFTEDTFNDYDREEKLLAQWIVRRKMKPLRKKINDLAFLNIEGLYKKLFSWSKNELEGNLPLNWQKIREMTIDELTKKNLNFEDATPFLYLKDKIEGKQIHNSIRYLFIDEAQDYSPFQFSFLKEVFPNSRMTILGDINQSIFVHSVSGEHAYSHSDELFPQEELEKIILTKSYRSTKQIVEFTEDILIGDYEIEPFNRNGKLPVLTMVNNKEELHWSIIERVQQLHKEGHETIAIICKTAKETNEAYIHLKHELDLRLIEKQTNSYEKGLLIIPSYLAKGIEFDAVIIYNCAMDVYDQEDERKLFYTACTRAMHELYLYSNGPVNSFMKNIDKTKYEIKN